MLISATFTTLPGSAGTWQPPAGVVMSRAAPRDVWKPPATAATATVDSAASASTATVAVTATPVRERKAFTVCGAARDGACTPRHDVATGEALVEDAQCLVLTARLRSRCRRVVCPARRANDVDDDRGDGGPEREHEEAHRDPTARAPTAVPVVHHGRPRPPSSLATSRLP